MTPKEAISELQQLLGELKRLGGPNPSPELEAFLRELGRRNVRREALGNDVGPSGGTRVARKRRVRDLEAMARTIEELARKLRAAFKSDAQFEAVISEASKSDLTKDNVIKLYNTLFETNRKFGGSTKPEVYNAIRRDRIARVRAGS